MDGWIGRNVTPVVSVESEEENVSVAFSLRSLELVVDIFLVVEERLVVLHEVIQNYT